jgi:hypothetical protein
MPGTIIALDVAIRTGVAEGVPGNAPNIFSVNFGASGGSQPDIFAASVKWATRTFETTPPGLLVIEGVVPQYNKTIQSGLCGIFIGFARANNVPVREAPVQTWRSFVLGNGRLPKREAKTRAIAACTQLGWPVKNDDEAEAACIWLWACAQVAPKLAPRIPFFMRGAA